MNQLQKTAQETASKEGGSGFGSLSKAGATAIGLDTKPSYIKGNGTTQHWKSTYNQEVEHSLTQPVQKSVRPEWSLPRQAYQSKRSFFYTESMKSYGSYGDNPLKKLHEQ